MKYEWERDCKWTVEAFKNANDQLDWSVELEDVDVGKLEKELNLRLRTPDDYELDEDQVRIALGHTRAGARPTVSFATHTFFLAPYLDSR